MEGERNEYDGETRSSLGITREKCLSTVGNRDTLVKQQPHFYLSVVAQPDSSSTDPQAGSLFNFLGIP